MKERDNSKIHIRSNFLLSVCLLIMLDTFITRTITTLQHFATLHPTTLHYTYFYGAPHQKALGCSVQRDRYMDEVKRLVKVKKLITNFD
jgi:hypothetical protein